VELSKIVSGGQTGANRAGLDVALIFHVLSDALFWDKSHPGMLGGPGEG
jgi:hypothetical protein